MKKITKHVLNPANDRIEIFATDEPGAGGAHHEYRLLCDDDRFAPLLINFQKGPIPENGVNGVTNEALLALVQDRLWDFQTGPFACAENSEALEHVTRALNWLHARTARRMARGVEGTLNK